MYMGCCVELILSIFLRLSAALHVSRNVPAEGQQPSLPIHELANYKNMPGIAAAAQSAAPSPMAKVLKDVFAGTCGSFSYYTVSTVCVQHPRWSPFQAYKV
jgi:hypothetical protein